ncbi:MAG: D-alanine--D-alanine ligase B [Myxococcota bacterium]|nr:D-alanine--D-alanine ligase B [Myxococcota bacterium]
MKREELIGKTIGVLMGGLSSEREVSLRSGKGVAAALRSLGYRAVEIDVGRDVAAELRAKSVEVVFLNALHGRYGEDGCMQGLLECMGIPYTGPGVLASALAMNKVRSKEIFRSRGIPSPAFAVFRRGADAVPPRLASGWPLVVKPANEGSSVGVSIVRKPEDFAAALETALKIDHEAIAEEYIAGKEVVAAIVDGRALGALEVRPATEFYTYEAKYVRDDTQYICPAPLDGETAARVLRVCEQAHESLGCEGVTRVDTMVNASGEPFVLEVNTLPGMTSKSLVPKIAAWRGISYERLCEIILEGASLKV